MPRPARRAERLARRRNSTYRPAVLSTTPKRPDDEPAPTPSRLEVRGLRVELPDGRPLLDDLSLDVVPGEVVVLLGGSGAGKSNFSRVLSERTALERGGFRVVAERLALERDDLGLVPQRGALFDHLDVRGNLDLALRYGRAGDGDPETWLERVGLDPALASPGVPVSRLSGGQAQRVAVARVLAGGRQLLFFDEPSVGLDPHRVRVLARLIRGQVEALGLAAIVVTHDVALAAGVADRLYVLDPHSRKLDPLFSDTWPGPLERRAPGDEAAEERRGAWLVRLERALVEHIARTEEDAPAATPAAEAAPAAPPPRGPAPPGWRRALARRADALFAPFGVAAASLRFFPGQLSRHPRDVAVVSRRVLYQALLRPLPFYAIVSVLVGFTVLYVISKVGGAGVRPDALVRQIGGSYVVALAPALSAILFVAASGSAVNAWLGSMGLTKQVLAMEALGVDSRAYLWAPTFVTLALCYLVVAAVFVLGMIAGGALLCAHYGLDGGWQLLSADLLDPRPERVRYAVRAAFLFWIYAWGIASDVIAKGGAAKPEADAVTRGMTASVVASTLWVVCWELGTVIAVLS
jgi:ABC-type transporter Mla maintaining outer membrane lipid asymmetry ATPase subunit MlaF/ABC-type transporter Mla maintaining outer membrane lipid asymmetry permease subunit MlaE